MRWTTTLLDTPFAADPIILEIPEDFIKKGAAGSGGQYAQFPNPPSLDPTNKPITVETWITTTKTDGVIMARGGPTTGFALLLKDGQPTFLVRTESEMTMNSKRISESSAVGITWWL